MLVCSSKCYIAAYTVTDSESLCTCERHIAQPYLARYLALQWNCRQWHVT